MGFFKHDVPVGHPNFGKLARCENAWHVDERLERMSRLSQLSRADLSRKLSDISETPENRDALIAAQEAMDRGYGWLYIWGGPGNAKSEILKAIVNHFNHSGQGPAVFTTLGNLLDYMRSGFQDGSYDQKFVQLRSTKVLGIDELDKTRSSDWVEDFTFHFLNERYNSATRQETLTVFVGQPHPADLFGEVVYDRFRDGRFRVVENKAPSARPNMRWGE